MRRSLEAARGRSATIRPQLCREFVRLWKEDLRKWQNFLHRVPVSSDPDKFLWEIGMSHLVRRSGKYVERCMPVAV